MLIVTTIKTLFIPDCFTIVRNDESHHVIASRRRSNPAYIFMDCFGRASLAMT
jgi:hypothetical protein